QVLRMPRRAPTANAVAERFVCTVRTECLDWLFIANSQHLQWVLRVFVDHYIVLIARWVSFRRLPVVLQARHLRTPPLVCTAVIVLADCYTSTPWQPERRFVHPLRAGRIRPACPVAFGRRSIGRDQNPVLSLSPSFLHRWLNQRVAADTDSTVADPSTRSVLT